MYQNVKNLDEVETFLRNYFQKNELSWSIKRGKETIMLDRLMYSHNNYEVLQVFKPVRGPVKLPVNEVPFAEFWKGHYSFFPNSYTGFYAPYFFKEPNKVKYCFSVPMGLAIRAIIEEIEFGS